MAQSTHAQLTRQLDHLRRSFAQQPGLPFADLLPDDTPEVLATTPDPIYTPLVTLGMFLSQVLEPGSSCQKAVARFLAGRSATTQPPCSANTGAYCKARQRLPEEGLRTLTQRSGATLARKAPDRWQWKGRRVRIADGTTVTAADTPANQREYPQPDGQKPGLGFPMIRLVVLFCLATGVVLQAALAPYQGKGTGELSLLRQLWHQLDRGDVLVGDRIYCSYFEIAWLSQRGVDVVLHKHQSRKTDFRTGRRLGRHDHTIEWNKPVRPEWMDEASYQELAATLTDPREFSGTELGELYRRRWEAELNLRSLKSSMGLDQLSCKSPEMVRKELWVYLLGYNLVRGVMAESASGAGVAPRSLSFAGAMQTLLAFGWVLSLGGDQEGWRRLWKAVSTHRVGDRPGRVEPRAIKRRKKGYPQLSEPRKLAQQRLLRAA